MCNHYLGYFYDYDGIEEIRQNSEFKTEQWIYFLDGRRNFGFRFNYCPLCGYKFNHKENLKDIKNQIEKNKKGNLI